MSAPIIIPRGMDELLSERRDASHLASYARFNANLPRVLNHRQVDWLRRLNERVAREAVA